MTVHASAGSGDDPVQAGAATGAESEGARAGAGRAACPGGMSVEEYAGRIAEEMHRRIDLQRALIVRLVAERSHSGLWGMCPLVVCPKLSKIEDALKEAIEVLDETRSAFKSRRLEVLRKKLTEVLSDR